MRKIFIASKTDCTGTRVLGPFSNFKNAFEACRKHIDDHNMDCGTTYAQALASLKKTGTGIVQGADDFQCRIQLFHLNRPGRWAPDHTHRLP